MSETPTEQKRPPIIIKHGDHYRQRRIRQRGMRALDARTQEARDALAWRAAATKAKGGAACPHWLKIEIRLACFDLWRLLCLQTYLISDANERQALINKRYRVLPSIHQQYNEIESRFARRVEALQLDKRTAGGLDLATMLQQRAQEAKG
jgi:hypothetical protein